MFRFNDLSDLFYLSFLNFILLFSFKTILYFEIENSFLKRNKKNIIQPNINDFSEFWRMSMEELIPEFNGI